MEPVSMNDGLDRRETVALGLGAGEAAVFVLALLTAYAALHTGLPSLVGWAVAGVLALAGSALAWGRLAGRSLLEWTVLAARFAVRTNLAARRSWRVPRLRPGVTRAAGSQSGAVVIPLALRRHAGREAGAVGPAVQQPPVAGPPGRRVDVVTFFSLNGGSGRTTLAVELATVLAVRGHAARAAGGRGLRVALLDLCTRNPAVALRLGVYAPSPAARAAGPRACLVTHATGLTVFCGPLEEPLHAAAPQAFADALFDAIGQAGADLVVADVDCDLGELCLAALGRSTQVYCTITPTAGGVLDAYRSTALLRRMGLGRQVRYVVNRCRGSVELDEVMGDLRGTVVAQVPEDPAFLDAENRHHVAALTGGPAALAIAGLAEVVEHRAACGRLPFASAGSSNAG